MKSPRFALPFALKVAVSASLLSVAGIVLLVYLSYGRHSEYLSGRVVGELAATVRNAALFPPGDISAIRTGNIAEIRRRLDLLSTHNPEAGSFRLFAVEESGVRLLAQSGPSDDAPDSAASEDLLKGALEDCVSSAHDCVTPLYSSGSGNWISAFAPIVDADGRLVGVLAADRRAVELEKLVAAELKRTVSYSLLAVVASTALGVVVSLRVTRPLKRLYAATEAASHGKYEPIEVTGADEVAALAEHFNSTHNLLLVKMHELEALADELENRVRERTDELSQSYDEARRTRDALLREISVARRVQETIIPQGLETDRLVVAVEYLPILGLGGDWGIVAQRKEGLVDLAIGDVTGHGIGSALVVNRVSTLLSQMCSAETDPSTLLQELDTFLAEDLSGIGIYMSFLLMRLDPDKMRLVYAGAGHPPAVVYSADGALTRLESHCGLLGIGELFCDGPMVSEFDLKKNDLIVLVTDGLIEAFDDEGRQFGLEALERTVRELASRDCACRQLAASIAGRVKDFTGGRLQDDVLVIVAKLI